MKVKTLLAATLGVSALCISGFFGTRTWAIRTGKSLADQGAPTFARAKSRLELAHSLGSSHAAYRLGMLFWDGKSVDTNYPEAIKWLQRAADSGDGDALYQLFWAYKNGFGVKTDAEKAQQYLRQAVREKHPKAMGRLADDRLEGANGEAKDGQEALRLAVESARGEDPGGLYLLGRIKVSLAYPEGPLVKGATGTPREGLELIEKAAEKGHGLAAFVIGAAYLAMPAKEATEFTMVVLGGEHAFPTNFGSAAGMSTALNTDGKLLSRDLAKAERFLLLAAKEISTGPGEMLFRKIYQSNSINPNPDSVRAKQTLERLLEAGDSWAPFRLGMAYLQGEAALNIQRDEKKGYSLLQTAHIRGDANAFKVIDILDAAARRNSEPFQVERLGIYAPDGFPRIQGIVKNVTQVPHNARVVIDLVQPNGTLIENYSKTFFGILPGQSAAIDIAIAPYHRNAQVKLRGVQWQ